MLREDLNTKTDILLWEILQELKKLNGQEPNEQPSEGSKYTCKKCSFSTDNKGLLLAHYRDHKKEGAK